MRLATTLLAAATALQLPPLNQPRLWQCEALRVLESHQRSSGDAKAAAETGRKIDSDCTCPVPEQAVS